MGVSSGWWSSRSCLVGVFGRLERGDGSTGIACRALVDACPQFGEHVLHVVAHVAGEDVGDCVVLDESGDAGVVGAFCALGLGDVPVDGLGVPGGNGSVLDCGDGQSAGLAPAVADLPVVGDGDADDLWGHVCPSGGVGGPMGGPPTCGSAIW